MKREVFLAAIAAGSLSGTLASARLLPAGLVARLEWRRGLERVLAGTPGRCMASRRENPWGGYHLDDLLG